MTETTPQMLARVLKERGGRILIVGGSVEELGAKYVNHPQLQFWDDNRSGRNEGRTVPQNTRAVIMNRWVSHSTRWGIDAACKKLGCLQYMNLRTREIKELLAEIVQSVEPREAVVEDEGPGVKVVVETISPEGEVTPISGMQEEDQMAKKVAGRGKLQEFLAKHMKVNIDYSVKGAITKEGDRIYAVAQREGFKTTAASVKNGLGQLLKKMGTKRNRDGARKPDSAISRITEGTSIRGIGAAQPSKSSKDDFQQLDELIADAIAAMKLVQEHIPKVKKETEKLRASREKVLKALGIEL